VLHEAVAPPAIESTTLAIILGAIAAVIIIVTIMAVIFILRRKRLICAPESHPATPMGQEKSNRHELNSFAAPKQKHGSESR